MTRHFDPVKLAMFRMDMAEMSASMKAMGATFERVAEMARNAGVEIRLGLEQDALPIWPPRPDPPTKEL